MNKINTKGSKSAIFICTLSCGLATIDRPFHTFSSYGSEMMIDNKPRLRSMDSRDRLNYDETDEKRVLYSLNKVLQLLRVSVAKRGLNLALKLSCVLSVHSQTIPFVPSFLSAVCI